MLTNINLNISTFVLYKKVTKILLRNVLVCGRENGSQPTGWRRPRDPMVRSLIGRGCSVYGHQLLSAVHS